MDFATTSPTVKPVPRARVVMRRRWLGEAAVVAALIATFSLAPAHAGAAQASQSDVDAQTLSVSASAATPDIVRGGIEATPAAQTYINVGTNEAWTKLVLMYGGWPVTEENSTVLLRWMRQENGPQNWFNRNNPLNNGYGSGGGGGTGSYPDLITAAQKAAENLKRGSGYVAIVKALAAGNSADAVARAIWASPWSSSHYANGTHWSTAPVDIVKAPAGAW